MPGDEGPIAPSTRGRKGGRKASNAKAEFTTVPGVGGTCSHCKVIVKTKQQSGTILAQHLFGCRLAPLSVRLMAWDACSTLQKSDARPIGSTDATARPTSGAAGFHGGAVASGSVVVGPRLSGFHPPAGGISSFLDRVSPAQASTIEAAIMHFFVANRVPFLVAESPNFIAMLRALRPAFVERELVPSRKKMAGPGLTTLYNDTRKEVLGLLAAWVVRRKAVCVLDAWENVKHHHIVNVLAVVGDKVVFLDSVYCGDECQDACGQARLVQEKLDQYGGMNTFNTLATDNTASCVEMRRLVSVAKPGLVSLNDQAHVANLLVGDLCKVSWMKGRVSTATVVSKFVRRHYRLLAAYEAAKDLYNKSLPADAAAKKQTAVSYVTPSATRFLYNRDLLAACVRNRPALRNILELNNGAELPRLVKPRSVSAREALASFFRVAESTADARDWSAARRILDPVCAYVRLFDGESARLSLVLPATRRLESDMAALAGVMRSEEVVCTASADVLASLVDAVRKRVHGPKDNTVRVLLLEDIHYLAAALDPRVFDSQASDVAEDGERAFRAMRTFFIRSPAVFSPDELHTVGDDERMERLRAQFSTYTALSGTSAHGAAAARKPGAPLDVAQVMNSDWDLWGWWSMYGGSTKALCEIGKALAGMVPSSCSVERSFSLQKSIQSLVRNRLTHEKVAQLMFVHTNINLLGGGDLDIGHLDFLKSVMVDAGGNEADGSDDTPSSGRTSGLKIFR